ncbi:hypothetical protein SSS_10603 [Sarcoptes scabiei]|nr:hypothetical protein SSS_10603 [Sarcoptes scabiei]
MSSVTSSYVYSNEPPISSSPLFVETPRRYFSLGILCCCISGFIFFFGIILMTSLKGIWIISCCSRSDMDHRDRFTSSWRSFICYGCLIYWSLFLSRGSTKE